MIYLFFQPESVNFRHTGLIIMSDGYGGPEDYYRFPLFGGYTGDFLCSFNIEEEEYAITWKSSKAQFFELPYLCHIHHFIPLLWAPRGPNFLGENSKNNPRRPF